MGFLEKLFSFFRRNSDPEAKKKKLIKLLAKEITGNRHSRFYKPRSDLIEPSLAKFFYEIYKTISPARVFLQGADRSTQLRELTVESFLDVKYLDARQRLSAAYVTERARTMPITEVARFLEEDLMSLCDAFTGTLISDADKCYSQILALIRLASFNYFSFLKHFDPDLVEQNFNYLPHFSPVRGQGLSDDLKNFLDLSHGINPDDNWDAALRVLKFFKKDIDMVVPEQWVRLLAQFREIRRSKILELTIQHIEKNPKWLFKPEETEVHIAQAYLEDRRLEVRDIMNGIVSAQKSTEISSLVATIFGDPDISRTRYSVDRENGISVMDEIKGFNYAAGISYLKIFLVDIFKKNIKDLCEMLLIRGQWSTVERSQEMSNSYNQILDITGQVLAFDKSLSDDGENGSRLQAAIAKADRDKRQARNVTHILQLINDQALDLINTTAQNLIIIGKNLKNIYEDYPKDTHEFIVNWPDLEALVEVPLLQQIIDVYIQIYNFIRLMQLIASQVEKPAPKSKTADL